MKLKKNDLVHVIGALHRGFGVVTECEYPKIPYAGKDAWKNAFLAVELDGSPSVFYHAGDLHKIRKICELTDEQAKLALRRITQKPDDGVKKQAKEFGISDYLPTK